MTVIPTDEASPSAPEVRIRQGRRAVLAVALVILVPKLIIAARTFGTNDIAHWLDFAHGVGVNGPVGVYSFHFTHSFYNHPPLIGFYLLALNAAGHIGISVPFGIRAVSSLADVASALLVFEIVRRRSPLKAAVLAGAGTAASPILFLISGFHGNTDPIFVMFALLSAFLLADKDRPALAGCAMAIAISIKIVPVVAIPCAIVYAFTRGRRCLTSFALGMSGVSLIVWTPALLTQWKTIKSNVFGYAGVNGRNWGLAELGRLSNQPAWATYIEGNGRTLVVAVCALVPAVLVWRNPRILVQGVAFSLLGFLALTPTFGVQYMAWAAAPSFVLGVSAGYAVNLLGGVFLFDIYDHWSRGLPWDRAHAGPFVPREVDSGIVVWTVLLAVMVLAIRQMVSRPGSHYPQPDASAEGGAPNTGALTGRHRNGPSLLRRRLKNT